MLTYLRKKMKTIMIIVAVLFAATMFYGLSYRGLKGMSSSTPNKDSIATVNGKEIDHKKYQQVLSRMLSQQKERLTPEVAMLIQISALDNIIDYTIVLDEAKKHFGAGGGEVDQAIDQIMQANKIPNKQTLEEALNRNMGVSLDEFKESIKEEIILNKMTNKIKSAVAVSPDDLREVKARHILVIPRGSDQKSDFEAKAKAESILANLKKGASFKDLAKKFSDDPGSASKGGELGYFTTGAMVPAFEKAAFSLKPGEISDVIKTDFGYHIIQVEDIRLRKIDTKGKDMNEVILGEKQNDAYNRWAMDLRKNTKVVVNEPLIQAHTMFLKGRLNEAIAQYNQASMNDPSNPYIHLFLGDAYIKAGNNEFAMAEYTKATQLTGADPGLLIAIGDIMVKMKKRPFGLEQYRRASIIAGDDTKVHQELYDVFKKLGDGTDAAAEKKELTRIEKKAKFEKEIQQKMGK